MVETAESNIPEADSERGELGLILESIVGQQTMFGKMVESLGSIDTHNAAQVDKQLNEASLFKILEAGIKIGGKILSLALENVLYLDNIAVANSDLLLNMDKFAAHINDQNFKIGSLDEHMETEIALHRIGYKHIATADRDSLVLMDKQGQQGQELIKLMADFSAKGATQATLTKMLQGIADINENTSTQARAAIRALEQLGDVEGVMVAMNMDQQLITNILGAIKITGLAPQQAIAFAKLADELIHPDDIRKAVLYGTIDAGRELLKKGQTPAGFLSVMGDVSKRIPAEFAERFESFMDPLLFDRGISIVGGELVNLAISMRTALDDPSKGEAMKTLLESMREYKGKDYELPEMAAKTAVEAYTNSLVKANDRLKDMFLAGGLGTLEGIRGGMAELAEDLKNSREWGAAILSTTGRAGLGLALGAIKLGLGAGDFIKELAEKFGFGVGKDTPLRFQVPEKDKDARAANPKEYQVAVLEGTKEGSKSGIIEGIEWLVKNGILVAPRSITKPPDPIRKI